jgi:hypothetical protein
MAGLHFVIAAILVGVGIYSVIATSRNDSTGCSGTGPCSDCSSTGCPDALISAPGVTSHQPLETPKPVSPVRVR